MGGKKQAKKRLGNKVALLGILGASPSPFECKSPPFSLAAR